MPTKIRLSRHGRKRYAFYHIVVADSRSPRDGKYIQRIGSYNPNTNPATIELDFDKALDWIQKGAQPTDTCRAILSYRGVMMKKHLLDGVKKGAFDEAEAEKRFNAWSTDKEQQVQAKIDRLANDAAASNKAELDREAKINSERAEAIAKRNSEIAAAEAAANAPEPVAEEASEETVEDAATPEATKEAAPEAKTPETPDE